jgi:SET domain-containing protein
MAKRSSNKPARAGKHTRVLNEEARYQDTLSALRERLPNILRRKSRLHGFGVFAAEPIAKNRRIIDYAGELVHNSKTTPREVKYLKEGCIWVFRVNRAWSRDAFVNGNIARFINHACRPNCWVDVDTKTRTIWIRASRSIAPGEELTYDYATVGDHTIQCRCRPGCKTML